MKEQEQYMIVCLQMAVKMALDMKMSHEDFMEHVNLASITMIGLENQVKDVIEQAAMIMVDKDNPQ